MTITLELCIFNPNVSKAKMCLRGVTLFVFKSAVCLQFSKWNYTNETHFGFTIIGSEMYIYRNMAIRNFKF